MVSEEKVCLKNWCVISSFLPLRPGGLFYKHRVSILSNYFNISLCLVHWVRYQSTGTLGYASGSLCSMWQKDNKKTCDPNNPQFHFLFWGQINANYLFQVENKYF